MIQIIYNRDKLHVAIEGHAGSAETGHDLVCASVSILAYTLAHLVMELNDGKQLLNATAETALGNALIECEPAEDFFHSVRLMFDTVCTGFELLSQNYPDNVSFEVVDENKGETI